MAVISKKEKSKSVPPIGAYNPLFDIKLDAALKGQPKYLKDHLKQFVSQENALTICDYILAYQVEATSLSDHHKTNVILTLKKLSILHQNKPFKDMTRQEIIAYLDTHRKSEQDDPEHCWKATYNHYLTALIRFYRWLKYPRTEHEIRKKKPKPEQVHDISYQKRLEESSYDPSEMWNFDDYLTFIEFCPNKRDRCYVAMGLLDTGARPKELLKLSIEEMLFNVGEEAKQYADTVVNGKTGKRALAIIDAVGHLKAWLEEHLCKNNPKAPVFCDMRNGMKRIRPSSIYLQLRRYRFEYFPELLNDPTTTIPEEEKKQRLKELLRKPFNPYVFRHSFFTEYGKKHSVAEITQYGGWTKNSKVPFRYQHFFGNMAVENRLAEKGIKKSSDEQAQKPRVKYCPNCNEVNPLDGKFCINQKCKHVLTPEAYKGIIEEKEQIKQRLDIVANILSGDKLDKMMAFGEILDRLNTNPSDQLRAFMKLLVGQDHLATNVADELPEPALHLFS